MEFLDSGLAPYGGTAEVVFDRTSNQTLDLTGPAYSFAVTRRGDEVLGLISLEVDVRAKGKSVQNVPLVVQVSMKRPTVVTRKTVNQGAPIGATDVEVKSMTFKKVDSLGAREAGEVIGQRAKRYIPAGAVLEPAMLEPVPLVLRGQIVTLVSHVGGITVVTSGKAMQHGLLGEVIRVQASEQTSGELEGAVIGVGKVQIGSTTSSSPGQGPQRSVKR